jgi:transcriptional regulator with XRE-family HTH domain
MTGQKLAGAAQTQAYRDLLSALIALRNEAGLSQAELAKRLGKPPSFVGKYELGERRLDIIETMVIVGAMEKLFDKFWEAAGIELPRTF